MRTKAQAKTKLQEMLVAEGINQPDYLEKILKPATTFNDVADQWEAKRLPELAASTRHAIPFRLKKFMRPFFGAVAIDQIRTQQVNDFIRDLSTKMKPKTVHNVYKDFRSIVNWHRQERDLPKVTWYAKLPKLSADPPRWFTPAEIDILVNAAHGKYACFFRLAGYTGLRCGELCGLRYEDFDFERGVIHVRRSSPYGEQTKSPAGRRTVYVDPVTLEMVRQHLNGRRFGLVFQTRFTTPLTNAEINRDVLRPLCAKIGIAKGTMHAFRHGRISAMVATRLPEKFVQSQVGQVDKAVTRHYTHFHDAENHQMVQEVLSRGQNSVLWSNVN